MSELISIILAAGAGTRMKSEKAKVAHEACGKTMLSWVMDAAKEAGVTKNVVVLGHQADQVRKLLPDGMVCVMQEQQLGTGHAVMMAKEELEKQDGTVMVLCGDTPLITGNTLENAYKTHCEAKNIVTVVTAVLDNPAGYGRILRSADGSVQAIIEHKDATPEQRTLCEINSGIYLFEISALLDVLPLLKNSNSQGEFYLTDTLSLLIQRGNAAGAYVMDDAAEILGVNDRSQLAEAEGVLQKRILLRHMKAGVTLRMPETLSIHDDVVIGTDTEILPGTILEKGTIIGSCNVIGPNTRISASVTADKVTVMNSVVMDSQIGADTKVGPFAYLRPGSQIGEHVKIGDFVEIKKSIIGDGTKISHLSYVGDAEVGKDVNIGCGVVFVNYDGVKKNKVIIGDNAFIGCNTNLVSPVEVKAYAYIAAGSTITEDVPDYSLAIARTRQSVIKDWVKRKGLDHRNG
jgi:bifunctional UDP-N-acetylglucosamine pyrophosphorylase/glucosamine-1-phosphate N-acetyltransferase